MSNYLRKQLGFTLAFLCSFSFFPAHATHLVGDEFTYTFIDSSGGMYHYRVTLNLYEDCLAGDPMAIAQDNPAHFALYRSSTFVQVDGIYYTSSVPVPGISMGPCGLGGVPLCILKKTFIKDYYLPASATGYTVVYQRCCKNHALTNVIDPGDDGSSYICTIPPIGVTHHNNSAVFTNYPPEVIGVNTAFIFDCSATDADGDSLSYELCTASDYAGASGNISPMPPGAPPFPDVSYTPPLTFSNPMSCSVALAIDPVTGILTGTPNILGRYLVTVCCHEWRGGVLINTSKREFELAVQTISIHSFRPFAGDDSIIYVGDTIQFNASHGASYLWTPGTYLSSTTINNPVGHFTTPGVFRYVLRETSDSGCVGYDTVTITVIVESEMAVPNAFTPNHDGVNDYLMPISIKNSTLVNFKVYNRMGQLLYTGTTPGSGWDGTFNGKKQDMGSYFWELFYLDNNGKLQSTVGSATLIR